MSDKATRKAACPACGPVRPVRVPLLWLPEWAALVCPGCDAHLGLVRVAPLPRHPADVDTDEQEGE